MDLYIQTPKMSEILLEEFMRPNGISAYRLAQEIHVPVSRIQDILHDRRKITADTSLRLAKFFGVSEKYFLDIQNDLDLRELKLSKVEDIESIKPFSADVG
ncbi:MAG: HigA family addiction module antidote protein [Clostridiales bacterium]|nr:HigA family addiction module antidote protein [Clostridiales bacterium]